MILMWKENFVELGRPHMKIQCMRIPCWILKATNTHSECLIFISFPLQQWVNGRALTFWRRNYFF